MSNTVVWIKIRPIFFVKPSLEVINLELLKIKRNDWLLAEKCFILSLRINSRFITLRPDLGFKLFAKVIHRAQSCY